MAWATSASRTTPTLWVLVIATGPPSSPASRIHSRPVSSPLPLSRWQPANTGSAQTSSVVRHHDRHAGPHGPSADDQRAVALDEGRVADADAADVGDRVVRTRLEAADADAELSSGHVPSHTGPSPVC